jgi:hypothetical protein
MRKLFHWLSHVLSINQGEPKIWHDHEGRMIAGYKCRGCERIDCAQVIYSERDHG